MGTSRVAAVPPPPFSALRRVQSRFVVGFSSGSEALGKLNTALSLPCQSTTLTLRYTHCSSKGSQSIARSIRCPLPKATHTQSRSFRCPLPITTHTQSPALFAAPTLEQPTANKQKKRWSSRQESDSSAFSTYLQNHDHLSPAIRKSFAELVHYSTKQNT